MGEVQLFGFSLRVDPRDDVGRHLILGQYEDAEVHAFEREIRPGQTVVDVGANLGVYALVAGRAAGESGRVVAIEPNPRVVSLLRTNVEINAATNVSVLQAAAADREGSVVLHLDEDNQGLASVARGNVVHSAGSVIVSCVRLDDLVPPRSVNVLKIDAQGSEVAVLRGARNALAASATVFLEVWPAGLRAAGSTPDELFDELGTLALDVFELDGRAAELTTLRRIMTADVSAVNLVARR